MLTVHLRSRCMTKSPTLIKKKEHNNFKVIQGTSYRFDIYIKNTWSFYILFLPLVSFNFVNLRHCSIISTHNYNCSSSCFEFSARLFLDFPFEALFFTSNQALMEIAFLINTFNKSNKQQKFTFFPFLKSGGEKLPGKLQDGFRGKQAEHKLYYVFLSQSPSGGAQ